MKLAPLNGEKADYANFFNVVNFVTFGLNYELLTYKLIHTIVDFCLYRPGLTGWLTFWLT